MESLESHPGHRGADPEDTQAFSPAAIPVLREATRDLCWLLDRQYALASATELVGNRYGLTRRQRLAIGRCACGERARASLRARERLPEDLRDGELWIDGFNVLLVLETALGGGVVLIGHDACVRDITGVHRRYRKVAETRTALQIIGTLASGWGVGLCRWWLDSPIANSGRLRNLMEDMAAAAGWHWQVDLVFNPDRALMQLDHTVATSDRAILDHCGGWFNLARRAIKVGIPDARLIQLGELS